MIETAEMPFGLPTPVSTGSGSKGRVTGVAPCLPLSPLGGTPLTWGHYRDSRDQSQSASFQPGAQALSRSSTLRKSAPLVAPHRTWHYAYLIRFFLYKTDGRQVSQQQSKKSDDIANKLLDRIAHGGFEPGEKLRQDLIAREFGVSQVTVREALLHVVSTGLATSQPRRGVCVSPVDQTAVEELRVMRGALEPVAVLLSVPNLTREQIAEIEALNETCNEAETSKTWEEANRRFHMALIAACNMPRLIAEIDNLQRLYMWHFSARHTTRWRKRDDPDHAALLKATKAGDAEVARAVMQRHLSRMS